MAAGYGEGMNKEVRRGLALLAVAGVGLVAWMIGLALMQNTGTVATAGTLIGLVGVLVTLGGLVAGLGLVAVGLIRNRA